MTVDIVAENAEMPTMSAAIMAPLITDRRWWPSR